MEIQLVNSTEVRFGDCQREPSKITLSNGREFDFKTRWTHPSTTTALIYVTTQLLEELNLYGSPKLTVGHCYSYSLKISVGFSTSKDAESGLYQGYIEVLGLDDLINVLFGGSVPMESIKIGMSLGTLSCTYFGGESKSIVPIDSTHVLTLRSGTRTFSGENLKVRSGMPVAWYTNTNCIRVLWTSELSLKLIVCRIVGPDPAVTDHLASVRAMLTEEVCCDAIIVAQNGAKINCHRSFLAAQSAVFKTMFQVNMTEAQTGKVEMVDMAEGSVRALLDYLYLWEIKAPQESSLVCFELREAGHKYGIQALEKATEKILLRMEADWYDAEVALRLYLFSRGLDHEALKVKALKVLKSKVGELKELPAYQKVIKKNDDIAIQISECLATSQGMENC